MPRHQNFDVSAFRCIVRFALRVLLLVSCATAVRAQDPISIKDLKQGFSTAYKNEQVSVRGWVATERRVASQTFKGFYLRDRFGDRILVRTTDPLPDITSEIMVVGVALQDADTGDIYISEKRRESISSPGSSAQPAPPGAAPQDLEKQRIEQERQRQEAESKERERKQNEEASQRQTILLVAIGAALVVLIGVAIFLMRRKPVDVLSPSGPAQVSTSSQAAPDYSPHGAAEEHKIQEMVDDFKTVKVYKTTKVLPGKLIVLENCQETDIVHLTDQSGRGEIEIGRDSPDISGGIRIKDKTNTLSRRQARLLYSASAREFKLLNLAGDSSNPTIINGRQMTESETAVLKDGDTLSMGSIEMKFRQS